MKKLLFPTCTFALGLAVAPAAIVVTNPTSATPLANSTTLTWSQTISSGSASLLAVGFGYENLNGNALGVTSVTYNGVSLTQAVQANAFNGTSTNVSALYYLVNPSVGTFNIQVTLSAAPLNNATIFGGSLQATGINQANPLGTTGVGTTTASGTTIANSYTLGSGVDYLLVDFAEESGGLTQTLTGSNGQTELNFAVGVGSGADLGYRLQTGTGAPTSSNWAITTATGRMALGTAAFVAVPEPSTAILLFAAGTSLCLRRNRRKS